MSPLPVSPVCPACPAPCSDDSLAVNATASSGTDHGATQQGLFLQYLSEQRPRYYRLAYSFLRNEADTLDAISQLQLITIEKGGTIRDSRCFPAWSKKVLCNICKNKLKERQRLWPIPEEAQSLLHTPPINTGVEMAELVDIRRAIAELPCYYRQPLLLRYYYGYDYAEIAALLHIPGGTVKSRLHRAIAELRRRLREEGKTLTYHQRLGA